MRGRDDRDLVLEREVEADASAVAVAGRGELGHALGFERGDNGASELERTRGRVPGKPGLHVEALHALVREDDRGGDGFTVEVVDEDGLEAVPRVVVGKELRKEQGISA